MRIAVPRERRDHETRVAATPDTIKRLIALGAEVVVESDAGLSASYVDEAYRAAGATIVPDAAAAVGEADIVLKVQRPLLPGEGGLDELGPLKRGALLVGMLSPFASPDHVRAYAGHGVTAFSMELMPRITRAQTMDVLSSQSNLAGYKAVLDAASEFGRALPQMMTAAGTIAPARVTVLGAGVAGLQAIATARRLGGRVSAFDVRRAAKEQVESLGATFIEVDAAAQDAQTAGGYAAEASEDYQRKQAAKLHDTLKTQDIVICTALVFGRKAPVLITEDMVRDMKPGSVIVDLAVEQGGNCTLSEPGKVVRKYNVAIVGHLNVPGRLPVDASALYARNLVNFLTLIVDKETKGLKIDWEDEIIKATALTRDGAVVHPSFLPGAS
jgi:NAD(P) transhydrogenase subunit alpha